ncbi:MAG: hypothetical protein IJV71_12145 [Lachnospiraceae bacterium]|nr:hypothetical protein [Lachnospiraceae bacterium]
MDGDIKDTDVIEKINENADTATAEEIAGGTVEEHIEKSEQNTDSKPEKLYTQEEYNAGVEKRVARERAKIHRQYEKQVELANVVCAGTGQDLDEATKGMREYYQSKGRPVPTHSPYSDRDIKILAEAEAKEIIDAGSDEVDAELRELAKLGPDKLNARQKEKFLILDSYQKQEARVRELASIGVPDIVYNSKEFKDFARQFNAGTPMSTVYELYTKATSKPKPENPGSKKNPNPSGDMDIFTPEEVDKLTPKDYDNPKIFEKVRRSMLSW